MHHLDAIRNRNESIIYTRITMVQSLQLLQSNFYPNNPLFIHANYIQFQTLPQLFSKQLQQSESSSFFGNHNLYSSPK